jgi:hypothetical protein
MVIECFSHRDSGLEIYVDVSGNVWPCCFIGSELHHNNIYNIENNNLHNSSLFDILAGQPFREYPSANNIMCNAACSKSSPIMDIIYDKSK